MAEKKEVAEKKATAIATFDDSLLTGGTGLEDTTTEDFAIPFIRVLQPMSPQLQKQDGKVFPGAEAQVICTTRDRTHDAGEEGISYRSIVLIIRSYLEGGLPREKGGGNYKS